MRTGKLIGSAAAAVLATHTEQLCATFPRPCTHKLCSYDYSKVTTASLHSNHSSVPQIVQPGLIGVVMVVTMTAVSIATMTMTTVTMTTRMMAVIATTMTVMVAVLSTSLQQQRASAFFGMMQRS